MTAPDPAPTGSETTAEAPPAPDTPTGTVPAPSHVAEGLSEHPDGLGHLFTISEAAAACGVSRDTVKRHRADGKYPHALQDSTGTWLIPLADLLADGLTPNGAATDAETEDADRAEALGAALVARTDAPGDIPRAVDERRIWELEAENRRLRDVLAERDRALTLAEQALRALPAGPPPPGPTPGHDAPAPGRRPWWRRG